MIQRVINALILKLMDLLLNMKKTKYLVYSNKIKHSENIKIKI